MGIYAFKASPQTVQIDSFNGNPVQNFSLNSGEEIKGLAFSPDNNLTITTSKATLISLTPNPCLRQLHRADGLLRLRCDLHAGRSELPLLFLYDSQGQQMRMR